MIVNKVKIVHNRRNGKTGFYESINSRLFEYCFESEVTNGLGYEPINHHEDSQNGLTRHLLEMSLREIKRENIVYHSIMTEMISNLFILDGDRNFYKHITRSLLKNSEILEYRPDGIFISNKVLKNLIPKRKILGKKPTKK